MKKITIIILLIFIIIVSALIGGELGFLVYKQVFNSQKESLNALSSSVIQSVFASGEVFDVDNKKIILVSDLDVSNRVIIEVVKETQIYYYIDKDSNNFSPKNTSIEFIKKGHKISADLKILPNGNLQAKIIKILNHID